MKFFWFVLISISFLLPPISQASDSEGTPHVSQEKHYLGDSEEYLALINTGDPKGYFGLGVLIENDLIKKDSPLYKEPIYYYCKAALAGVDSAQFRIGMMINWKEIDVPDSKTQGRLWQLLAAHQGIYRGPFYKMGTRFMLSAPVQKDCSDSEKAHFIETNKKALYYYLLSDPKAGTQNEEVKDPNTYSVLSNLTEEQIAEVRHLVSKWRPRNRKESMPMNVLKSERPDTMVCDKIIKKYE